MRPLIMGSNALAFLLMGIDKWRAVRGAWRISEKMLFSFPFWAARQAGPWA